MNKAAKIIVIIALCLIGVGAVISAAGFFSGARYGFYLDADGFHLAETSEEISEKAQKVEVDAFTSMDIKVDFGEVKWVASDHYGLEYMESSPHGMMDYHVED